MIGNDVSFIMMLLQREIRMTGILHYLQYTIKTVCWTVEMINNTAATLSFRNFGKAEYLTGAEQKFSHF